MNKLIHLLIYSVFISTCILYIFCPALTYAAPTATKRIGTLNGTNFVEKNTFTVGEKATYELTINGPANSTSSRRVPMDVMFVVDDSGSTTMANWPGAYSYGSPKPLVIEVAQYAMKSMLDMADPTIDRFGLVYFKMDAKLTQPLTNDFNLLKSKIDGLPRTDGGSDLGEGALTASQHLVAQSRPDASRNVILLSDGGITCCAPWTIDLLDPSVTDYQINNGITGHSVGMGAGTIQVPNSRFDDYVYTCPIGNVRVRSGEEYLKCYSQMTGGTYTYGPDPDSFVAAFQAMVQIINENLSTSVEDYINTTHFQNPRLVSVTDLYGNTTSDTVTITGNRVSADFGNLSSGDGRRIYVEADVTAGSTGTSWSVTADAQPDNSNSVNYTVDTGSIQSTAIFNNPLITVHYPLPGSISGRVYLDLSNNCSLESGEAGTNSASLRLDQLLPSSCSPSTRTTIPDSSGNYTFSNLDCFEPSGGATYRLFVTSTNADFTTTTCGNSYTINLSPGEDYQINPPLSVLKDPWFQLSGGSVYAHGMINSPIPNSAIDKYIISSNATLSAGHIATDSTIQLDNGDISSKHWSTVPYSETIASTMMPDQVVSMLQNYIDDPNYDGSAPKAGDATDGIAVYSSKRSTLTLSGNWQHINFPVIVIMDSTAGGMDVRIPSSITQGHISLNQKGFLMIIARDIFIDSGLGEDDNSSTSPTLEGLFIARRNFDAGGSGDPAIDKRLNISGSVITGTDSLGGYTSQRTHEENYLYPADYFVFNPKLLLNYPSQLMPSHYSWNEVH
ncbi:VWA domain-containing protein [candidate division WWE3 bacterium]|nr:VWA domain-containing protein [candidate division WWE3 bacterium]